MSRKGREREMSLPVDAAAQGKSLYEGKNRKETTWCQTTERATGVLPMISTPVPGDEEGAMDDDLDDDDGKDGDRGGPMDDDLLGYVRDLVR